MLSKTLQLGTQMNKMDINQEIDNKSKYAVSFGLALRELDKS